MTVLHPCLRCHRKDDCEIKQNTLKQIRGAGVTKAKLRCKIPEQDFPLGSVVSVQAFEIRETARGDFDDLAKVRVDRVGVVRSWRDGKACVVLNKDQEIQKLYDENDRIGFLHVTSDRLTRISDAFVDLCKCGLPESRCQDGDMPSVRGGAWFCGFR